MSSPTPASSSNASTSNVLDLWSTDATEMNIANNLLYNIRSSSYYRDDLYELTTYDQVLVEIANEVEDIRSFERESDTKSHVSFILLYKLFKCGLTRKQLHAMIRPKQLSSYVRALGFLFVRYCIKPADMWEFFEPYILDMQKIRVMSCDEQTTIGEFIRSIIDDQKYLGTLFPRIPQPALVKLKSSINAIMDAEESPSSRHGRGGGDASSYRPGSNKGKHDKYEDRYYSSSSARSRPQQQQQRLSRSPPPTRRRSYQHDHQYQDEVRDDGRSSSSLSSYRHRYSRSPPPREQQQYSNRRQHDYDRKRPHRDDDDEYYSSSCRGGDLERPRKRERRSRSRSRSLSPAESRFNAPAPVLDTAQMSSIQSSYSSRATSTTGSRSSGSSYAATGMQRNAEMQEKIVLGTSRYRR